MTIHPKYGSPVQGPLLSVTLEMSEKEAWQLRAILYLCFHGPQHSVNGNTLSDYRVEREKFYHVMSALDA